MYYKRIISGIIDKHVEENQSQAIEQARQAQIKNAKYCIRDIYVGYVAKRLIDENNKTKFKQLVNADAIMICSMGSNIFKDIETNKQYPLISFSNKPTTDDYYIPERFVDGFVSACAETLYARGISENAKLTVGELRQIMQEQENLKQIYFN